MNRRFSHRWHRIAVVLVLAPISLTGCLDYFSSDGPYNAGHTTITLVHNVAIAGDWLEIFCDGTNFYVTGQTNADGGVTLA